MDVEVHGNMESRVTAVESAVEHIESGVSELKASIGSGFADLHERIDLQTANQKPNIVAWAGWAAVLLLVIGMFGSGYIRDLNRVETDQTSALLKQQGHDISISTLQAEMESLEKEQDNYAGLDVIISNLQARMKNEETENAAHPRIDVMMSKHEAQIKALEREVFVPRVLIAPAVKNK